MGISTQLIPIHNGPVRHNFMISLGLCNWPWQGGIASESLMLWHTYTRGTEIRPPYVLSGLFPWPYCVYIAWTVKQFSGHSDSPLSVNRGIGSIFSAIYQIPSLASASSSKSAKVEEQYRKWHYVLLEVCDRDKCNSLLYKIFYQAMLQLH